MSASCNSSCDLFDDDAVVRDIMRTNKAEFFVPTSPRAAHFSQESESEVEDLMELFNSMNKYKSLRSEVPRVRFGDLCTNGTVTMSFKKGICKAVTTKPLYSWQYLGCFAPLNEIETVQSRSDYINSSTYSTMVNHEKKQKIAVSWRTDVHFSNFMEFSDEIGECNVVLLDDTRIAVLRHIFHGEEMDRDITHLNPKILRCYLGNWTHYTTTKTSLAHHGK